MAETEMTVPRGSYQLRRPDTPKSSSLRAWSAADQLMLDQLGTAELGRLLIVNDEFGALTVGLAECAPTVWTDSARSRKAIERNLAANDLPAVPDSCMVKGDDLPIGTYDTVLIRIPKTGALLEHQLRFIRHVCSPQTRVIGTGMVRHVHSSTVDAFERLVGSTTTSRATRKARLIYSEPNVASTGRPDAGLISKSALGFTTDRGVQVAENPGTFSAGHLDVGSALLLDVLHTEPLPQTGAQVADLGCGNGVLAATMAGQWTEAEFVLLDVSDLAIAAASETWAMNDLGDRAVFHAAAGYGETPADSLDVVITNPPFHQGHALDASMTDRLLADTAGVLKPDGLAYVVAQRHLHLHTRLKQWFDRVEVISKHPSHVVVIAVPGALAV